MAKSWKQWLLIALGPCCLLIAAVYLFWRPAGDGPTAAERAALAPPANYTARLAVETDPAKLRPLLAGGQAEPLRAAAAQRLGRLRDRKSLEQLVELMEDESPLVRGRAGVAVQQILGVGVRFKANAPTDERAKIVAEFRRLVEFYNQSPPPTATPSREPQR